MQNIITVAVDKKIIEEIERIRVIDSGICKRFARSVVIRHLLDLGLKEYKRMEDNK